MSKELVRQIDLLQVDDLRTHLWARCTGCVSTRSALGGDRNHLRRSVGEDHPSSGADPVGDGQSQATRTAGKLEHLFAGSRRDSIDHQACHHLGALLDLDSMLTPRLGDRAPQLVDAVANLSAGGLDGVGCHQGRPSLRRLVTLHE